MRTIAIPLLNRLVGNEPGIAAASHAPGSLLPPPNVRLILIGNAQGKPVKVRGAALREMEDKFVTVVQEAIAVDRLIVPDRKVSRQLRRGPCRVPVNRDGLDPMNDVL